MPEYIKREAALMKLMQDGCSAKNLQSISDMPAADVAPVVHGHKVDDGGFYARCFQCDGVLPLCANYCPNCGAKMDGKDGDNAGR
jgi:hypothetical protein